jgi:ABC-type glycerol-3-phosphate transport system substrate-binding protein
MANWFEGAVELNFPANREVFNSPYLQSRLPFAETQLAVAESSREDTHAFMPIVQDILAKGVSEAVRQKKTPKEALNWIVKEMERQKIF